jgi:hypothetical protein
MRNTLLIFALMILAAPLVMAGAGSDQPTNITITNPYSNNVNWAQFCWSTVNQSDSLVMIGESGNFSRQVYNGALTTNHCVVVKNLQPSTQYYYSVASCTDPVGGKQCAITDTNWSSAPWPTNTPTFDTAASTSGSIAFEGFATGPGYVYQGSIANIGIHLIQTSGVLNQNWAMLVTEASIDGMSCLPGTLLGANCGQTGISLAMLCDGNKEEVNPSTNNYPVTIFTAGPPFANDYVCWNGFFAEPGLQAKIVAGGGSQAHASGMLSNGMGHTLRLIFQLVDPTQNNIPVGEPQTVTYKFSVVPPAQFKVTAPTTFPPIPNYKGAIFTEGRRAPEICEMVKSNNQAGIYLNADFNTTSSNSDPWDVYAYDGNRVFKETANRFDGITGDQWQPGYQYVDGDLVVSGGYSQVVIAPGKSGANAPSFSSIPGTSTQDWGVTWYNAGNTNYWNQCSEIAGVQYLNWALNVPKWTGTQEWNIFPWGMYMDFLRQGDVLNENCDGGPTCSGLNAASNLRFGANILTYPAPGYVDENFTFTYYNYQIGTIRALPYNTNVLLADWLETGVQPANELKPRVDMLIQTIAEAINYSPADGPTHYACCYNASNFNVGLWAMTLIDVYDVQTYLNVTPDARIPVELMKLMDWFYSTQVNLLGNDNTFPYQPWAVPYNCSIFKNGSCANTPTGLNNLVAPAYAWLGAVYGDSCKLPTSQVKCWDAADQLVSNSWAGWEGTAKNFNQLFQDFSNYLGWRTGTIPGTDSYVLPTHNPLGAPYPDVIGPYPSGEYPAKPTAGNITNSSAIITWYTYEQAVSTVVDVGTDPNNINIETDCGPSIYAGSDNLWINTCRISGLSPNTLYYFGVGGKDAASNFAFSAVDPTNNLQGDTLNFTTTH